ncbi:MAG: nitrate- and nitrite sensing domain-containing protein, partial [Actinomycetota bacterium]
MTRSTRSRYDTGDGVAVNERNDGEAPRHEPSAARRSFLYNRSVRSRLGLLVLIPLIGALVLGAVIFYNAVGEASTARSVERHAETAVEVIDAVEKLQDERDVTTLAEAGRTGDGAVASDRDETDAAVASLQEKISDLPADTSTPIGEATVAVREELATLDEVRAGGTDRYRQLISALHDYVAANGAGLTDPDLVKDLELLEALTRATEAASVERGLLAHLITLDDATAATERFVSVSRTEQDLLLEAFAAAAEPADWVEYSEARKNVDVIRRDVLDGRDVTPEEWWDASTARIDVLRGLQDSMANSIVNQSSSAAGSAQLTAIFTAAVVLLVLVATVAVAYAVARSIVRPLRRLRSAALDAAGESGLATLVSRIQADGPAVVRSIGDAVTPEGSDEIGQVASAFNEVHATAVRVAGEQALLRQNLDTIVVNLSRRTQSLVDRQLGEIESLESRERDPDQLGTLFRIDHLATRVRRHAESLLVLAGVEEMRRQGVAAPVLDVVRTAVGEVEQYPRVKFGVMPTDLVVPGAVDDVAHLLAELLDNATEFSAPSTAVTVTSQPLLGGGLRLQVTDSGLGIPPDQLATLNQRLQEPGDIDVAASRTLGIYVVARLAARHGITVRIIPAEGTTGTIAQVDLPADLIVSPLDTTDGVLQAIQQPSEAGPSRTESLLNAQQPQQAPAPAQAQATQQAGPQPAHQAQPGQQPHQPAQPAQPAAPQQPQPAHASHQPAQPAHAPQQPAQPAQPAPQAQPLSPANQPYGPPTPPPRQQPGVSTANSQGQQPGGDSGARAPGAGRPSVPAPEPTVARHQRSSSLRGPE